MAKAVSRDLESVRGVRVVCVVAKSTYAADGVEDHARTAAAELERHGAYADVVVLDWRNDGVLSAARQFRSAARAADVAVLHVSQLAWTRRGLPFGLLALIALARRRARIVVWVHDPADVHSSRFRHLVINQFRRLGFTAATRLACAVVVSVHPSVLRWVSPRNRDRILFCPSPSNIGSAQRTPPDDRFTVSTFGIGIGAERHESERLEAVSRHLVKCVGPFRLRLLGAWSASHPPEVVERLMLLGVECDVPGRCEPAELLARLASSHAFLGARNGLTSRSSSLAAALHCGLPVVGFRGSETAPPLEDAGIIVTDAGSVALASALARIAADRSLQNELSERSLEVAARYFSWDEAIRVIALAIGLGER